MLPHRFSRNYYGNRIELPKCTRQKLLKKPDGYKLLPYIIHFGMIFAVALYVFLGALAIRRIEAVAVFQNATLQKITNSANSSDGTETEIEINVTDHDSEQKKSERNRRACMIKTLKEKSNPATCDRKDLYELAATLYDKCFWEQIHETKIRNEFSTIADTDTDTGDVYYTYWSLTDSVVFCFTVITTIGYGNVAPKTVEGRLFVIAYGILGIPFTMLAIASLGKFLAEILKQTAKFLAQMIRRTVRRNRSMKRSYKENEALVKKDNLNNEDWHKTCGDDDLSDKNISEKKVETWGEAVTLFVAFFIYIIIGSMVIASYEPEMDFFGAIYFNFVSLTTIGLGDLVPRNETYLVLTLVYSAIGLALTTIAIEIAAEYLKMLHYFGRKIDNVANVQIWFGGKKLTMKQLVRNLGDHFNLPVNEIAALNLNEFVDAAIKVEAGELATLRTSRPINVDIESMVFMDADESYMSQSYATNPSFSSKNS